MRLEETIEFCLSLPEVEEVTPFGPDTLVYKVCGKMFAATDPSRMPVGINLKCEPSRALDLRDQYDAVQPGWHMNKQHWNTVVLDGSLPNDLIVELVRDSYELVVGKLKKVDRERLEKLIAE